MTQITMNETNAQHGQGTVRSSVFQPSAPGEGRRISTVAPLGSVQTLPFPQGKVACPNHLQRKPCQARKAMRLSLYVGLRQRLHCTRTAIGQQFAPAP
jgi:hypothetical protein